MRTLHFLVGDAYLWLARVMRGELRSAGTCELARLEVPFDLLTTRARGLEIFLGVAADLGLSACASVDVVPQLAEAHGKFRAIDGGQKLLRLEEFSRLQRTGLTVVGFRHVEDDHVRVQLRCRIAVHRPRAVMLERGRHPATRGFGGQVATQPGLNDAFGFIQSCEDRHAVRDPDPLVSPDKRRQ